MAAGLYLGIALAANRQVAVALGDWWGDANQDGFRRAEYAKPFHQKVA